jgi:hypothetical protein
MASRYRYPSPHTGERRDPPFKCKRCGYLTTDGQAPVCDVCKGKLEARKDKHAAREAAPPGTRQRQGEA